VSKTDLVSVGRVGRPHGVNGAFFVEEPSGREEAFAIGAVLLANGEEATVVSFRRGSGGRPVIRLDRTVERGAELTVERATLPSLPAEEGEFYVFQLVGLSVEQEDGRVLGRVRDVLQYPANDVLELDSGVSLPLVEACVRSVDVEGERIVVASGFADPE
jgi:16S rRNA processing protein RimM